MCFCVCVCVQMCVKMCVSVCACERSSFIGHSASGLPSLCFRMPVYTSTKQYNFSRGVQHLWHTARNEAIAKGGKGSRTLDPVPATKFGTSYSYKLYMVPSFDGVAVQT